MSNIVLFLRDSVSDIVQFLQGMSFSDRVSLGISLGLLICLIRGVYVFLSLLRCNYPSEKLSEPFTKEEALEAVEPLIEDGTLQIVDSSGDDVTHEILLNGVPLSQQK